MAVPQGTVFTVTIGSDLGFAALTDDVDRRRVAVAVRRGTARRTAVLLLLAGARAAHGRHPLVHVDRTQSWDEALAVPAQDDGSDLRRAAPRRDSRGNLEGEQARRADTVKIFRTTLTPTAIRRR